MNYLHIYQNKLCVTHVLRVHGEAFPCNAAVLHAALPDIPADQWEETFSKVSPSLVDPLLRYMYTCVITVTMEMLKDLMIASKLLKLSHLQDSCEDLLKQELCPENCLGWYKFAMKEKFEAMASDCKERIYRELHKVRQCPQFHELSLADVSDVLNDRHNGDDADNDDKRSDTQFHAAMSWLLVEESRYEHAETLFDLIELSKCSKQCLKLATEEPYSAVLWSITLQNKLLRASLQSVKCDGIIDERYVPKEFTVPQELTIDLQMQPSADFDKEIWSRFKQFYANKLHMDITLKVSIGDVVDAHQVVLAVQSPYFEALIRSSAAKKHDGDSMTEMPAPAPASSPTSASASAPAFASTSALASGQASAPDSGQASASTCGSTTASAVGSTTASAFGSTTAPVPVLTTDLSHLDSNAVKTVVDMMYTGSADIQDSALLRLLEVCDFLQLEQLLDDCKQRTESGQTISDENCYDWIKAGRLFTLPDIQTRAVEYVCKNFDSVHHKDDFKTLERDDVLMILNSWLAFSKDEQSVYEAIIAWITHSPDSRRSCLSTLLATEAVKNSSVNTTIDMEALLEAFGVYEKVQVWKVHYNKLQEVWDRDGQKAVAAENARMKNVISDLNSSIMQLRSDNEDLYNENEQLYYEKEDLNDRIERHQATCEDPYF